MTCRQRQRGARRTKGAIAVAVTLAIAAAGCSSSSGKSNAGPPATGGSTGASGSAAPSGGSGGGKTITVGVIADVTGLAASSSKTAVKGIDAGVIYAKRQGYNIKYVLADTGTNPATALSAAQKLVTRDHVERGHLAFGDPVRGDQLPDGPWRSSDRPGRRRSGVGHGQEHVLGLRRDPPDARRRRARQVPQEPRRDDASPPSATASLPASSQAARSGAASAKAEGIKIGYLNANFPFGGTDVQPEVLAMKAAGVDGFTATTDPNTAFALVTGMRQAGADVKVAVFATGYGGDLEQAGPGALNAAQNVYFYLEYEPVEMNTPATKQFVSDLAAAGVSGKPTYAEYNGYLSVGLLVQALKMTGGNDKSAALINAMSQIHDWTALGLFGSHSLDLNDRVNGLGGADNCIWITKLEGNNFTLVPGADPICSKELSVTVPAS